MDNKTEMDDILKEQINDQMEYLNRSIDEKEKILKVSSGFSKIAEGFQIIGDSLKELSLPMIERRIKDCKEQIEKLKADVKL